MTIHELQHTPRRWWGSMAGWRLDSQQRARRNALVASTALVQRRHERVEVEEFLATLEQRRVRHTA